MFELVEEKNTEICMYDGCEKKMVSRGLCQSHYAIARRVVKKVKGVTWNKLEKKGKCLPARPPFEGINGASTQRDWFLEGFNGKSIQNYDEVKIKDEVKEIGEAVHQVNKILRTVKDNIEYLTPYLLNLSKKL